MGGRGAALGSSELEALYSDVALIHRGRSVHSAPTLH
jgi:hypothetical protein